MRVHGVSSGEASVRSALSTQQDHSRSVIYLFFDDQCGGTVFNLSLFRGLSGEAT